MARKTSKKTSQAPAKTRRAPRQARARALVDAILTATAHILREAGPEGATTNHIAQRAGVSIGSLYQYFPNKTALFTALARQLVERLEAELRVQVERVHTADLDTVFVSAVEAVLAIATVDARLQAALLRISLWGQTSDVLVDFRRRLETLVGHAIAARADEFPHAVDDPEVTAKVVVRAIGGVLDTSLNEDGEFDDPRLLRELTRLIASRFGLKGEE